MGRYIFFMLLAINVFKINPQLFDVVRGRPFNGG